jgi:hypothetical protein
MKNIWPIINVCFIALAVWTGYSETAPENLVHANPDALFCLTALLTMPVFVVGWLWLATKQCKSLRRPSFRRFPLNFWYDPLEFFFVGTFCTLANAIGSTLRRPEAGTVGYWMAAFFWCIFVGWIIGQLIGYAVFHDRISPA